MCGFIGVIAKTATAQSGFVQGLEAIRERGVMVDTLTTRDGRYGYSRLPTDDVHNKKLGQISRHGDILLFNGLITNVEYLVGRFGLPLPAKQSDTSCLKAGLAAQGIALLPQMRGMFAFAYITDVSILLARDTPGVKPLYYAIGTGLFAFASEMKALRPLAAKIYEVLPGQIIIYDKATCTVTKQTFKYQSYKQYTTAQLEECLREAVIPPTQRYLQNSGKNIALLLSGGLDSSLLAGLLSKSLSLAHQKRLVAFCIGENAAPDVAIAKRLAQDLGLTLVHVHPYTTERSLRLLPEMVYKAESPYSRVVKVALLYDALAVAIKKEHIDVVIGGEGADELFFGYHRFIEGLTHAQSNELFQIFFRKIFHYTLLQRFDRAMARRQIEGRVPYLDQELIELASRIPPEDKVQKDNRSHVSKLPLRDLAKRLGLPAYIYERDKEKMTTGATGKHNMTARNGYLEQEAIEATNTEFRYLVDILYRLHFGNALAGNRYTEEQAMHLVARYKNAASKQYERNYP